MEKIYTYDEVAQILRLTKQSIRKMCRSGKLKKTVLSPKIVRIKESDLQKYLDNLT
jgi:excisionase family DNA binding protein